MIMKLSDIKNGNLSAEWAEKGYELPKFDIEAVKAKTHAEPTWVHFGAGNIFRAFPAAVLNDALNSGKVAQYFCDFPTEELLGVKGVCCTPHLGASTPESETNCAVMAAAELSDYLKNGNIAHSVNLPDVSQPRVGGRRICIIHKNAPGAISAITSILTEAHLNIENMVNKGKKDVAYTLLDVTGNVTDDLAVKLGAIEPAIRVRVL